MRKGVHWLSWKRLSVHKNDSGMVFKDLTFFNIAMLGTQGWKFRTDSSSLVSRLFKTCYFPNNDYLGSRFGSNLSYVWKSIFSAKMVVNKGARWNIGTWVDIPLFGAPWLKDGLLLITCNVILSLRRCLMPR